MNDQPGGCPPELREALNSPVPSVRTPFTVDGQIDFSGLRAVLNTLSQNVENARRDLKVASRNVYLIKYPSRDSNTLRPLRALDDESSRAFSPNP